MLILIRQHFVTWVGLCVMCSVVAGGVLQKQHSHLLAADKLCDGREWSGGAP